MADFTNVVAATATPATLPYPGDIVVVPGEGPPTYANLGLSYINRVYDSVAVGLVSWVTVGSADLAAGAFYPGPGVYGADTSQGTVEAVYPS